MKVHKIADMVSGWFVGGFEPTVHYTEDFEVNYRLHPAGQHWDTHYHTKVKEINLLVRGKMTLQDQELNAGDIFVLEPWEIANPVFLEDCEVVTVKVPSGNDKVVVKTNG